MNLFQRIKNKFQPSPAELNRDLIECLNSRAEGKELPGNINLADAHRKSVLILPVLFGSHDISYDESTNTQRVSSKNIEVLVGSFDCWNVYQAFLEPGIVQNIKFPSLTRFITVPFTELPNLMSDKDADGSAVFFFTNKTSVALTKEQVEKIVNNPNLISIESIGLIEARENYRDISFDKEVSPDLRRKLCQKLRTMPDVNAVWLGHLFDRGVPKYFILFDGLGSSKAFFEVLKPIILPEINGTELMHIRYFDGFASWITGNIPQFYNAKEPDRCGWFIEEPSDPPGETRQHSKGFRRSFKQKRK